MEVLQHLLANILEIVRVLQPAQTEQHSLKTSTTSKLSSQTISQSIQLCPDMHAGGGALVGGSWPTGYVHAQVGVQAGRLANLTPT
jgi:hypothetical protein